MSDEIPSMLAVPDSFRETALAFPGKIRQALTLVQALDEAVDMLAHAEAMAHFTRRIRADKEVIGAIEAGKLLIVAKVGHLLPGAGPNGSGPGRGRKNGSLTKPFSKATSAAYRKVAANEERIEEYIQKVQESNAGEPEHSPEIVQISEAGFLRYVGSGADGNLKANQNKGVIEWYTPEVYVEAARDVMGCIVLDPASSEMANKVVKAETFFTKKDDGLAKPWAGTVFMNPPFAGPLIKAFVAKLCQHVRAKDVSQAVLLTNNNTDTAWWHQAAELCDAICFTRGRVAFYSPAGATAAATNGHTFFYFGKRLAAFAKRFGAFGMILARME